jgi:hypothetical protein
MIYLELALKFRVSDQREIPLSMLGRRSPSPLPFQPRPSQPKSTLCSVVGMTSFPKSDLSASEDLTESTLSVGSRWSRLISWVRWRLERVLAVWKMVGSDLSCVRNSESYIVLPWIRLTAINLQRIIIPGWTSSWTTWWKSPFSTTYVSPILVPLRIPVFHIWNVPECNTLRSVAGD